jgi:menaquinone-9 beta-reductase
VVRGATFEGDVLVVGAGPAGAAAAVFLAGQGLDTLVVDRAFFPRDKICGDGLAPRSVAMLQQLGVEERLRAAGYEPIREYRVVSTWGDGVRAGVPSWGKGTDYAYVVPRRELDAVLVARAREAGARVHEGVRVVRPVSLADPVTLDALSAENEPLRLQARVVIAADGSRGSFSRRVLPSEHVQPYAIAIRAYMEGVQGLGRVLNFILDRRLLPGYGWVFPSSRQGGPANVGVGMRLAAYRAQRERIAALFEWFLSPASMAWPYLQGAKLLSPPAPFPLMADFPRGRRRQGPVLFAGDAANLVDPLSGEGIAYALESGRAAADVASLALRTGRLSALARYDAQVWREFSLEFLGAYLLRQVLVHPWGNGLLIRLLRRDEGLARGGMGVLSNSVPATWLLTPRVWRRVLAPSRLAATLRQADPAAR